MLVMNPGLKDLSVDYLLLGLFHHCVRASTDSTDLQNELMQISDPYPFFRMWSSDISYDLLDLFAWVYKVRHFTDVLGKIIDEY